MVSVRVKDYHTLDNALKVFRRKVRRSHILEIYSKKSHYISPSEKKHKLRRKKGMVHSFEKQ